jgi:hypothetical protein
MRILLENVRTFAKPHTIPLGRITILTGENSAGKTTFMAMMAALHDELFPIDPAFDAAPYALGSYDTIATYKGGRYGRAKTFGIGYETSSEEDGPARRVHATYESDNGRVALANLSIRTEERSLELDIARRTPRGQIAVVSLTSAGNEIKVELGLPRGADDRSSSLNFQNALISALVREDRVLGEARGRWLDDVFQLSDIISLGHVVSVAPIRTRPERTYSQAKQAFEPTGDHIPFLLDRILSDGSSKTERRAISNALEKFGRESGLFENVSIKKLGSKATDPFQLMIQLAGRARNLTDVGYGVSQALPVVVQTVLESPETTILMQQPEVHLHPKAQAGLGTFFTDMASVGKRRLVIETHSDFILDRIRQEVASGSIPAEWVQILFFSRRGYETDVYPLSLDSAGNIVDAPVHYRDFFLREELALLTRSAG